MPIGQQGIKGGLRLEIALRAAYVGRRSRQKDVPMASSNPVSFIREVRAEVAKVAWPTRREVLLTTVMVFILAAITAVFFSIVDILIKSGLQGLLAFVGS